MSSVADKIGFMQGRLSPLVDGKIQAFPWSAWREEFTVAQQIGFSMMEWTLDQDRLYENPLMTPEGQRDIQSLCEHHAVHIPSLTGDCFMQAPFFKSSGKDRDSRERDFFEIAEACHAVGISIIVVPLVDNGRLENMTQEDVVVAFFEKAGPILKSRGIRVVFESDYAPETLARFIDRLDPDVFGINYDIGNSASLGYPADEEIDAYGSRIYNVHVKDRVRGGTTVPLGEGDADFDVVFKYLAKSHYRGNFILQTARAKDNNHASVARRYRDFTVTCIKKFFVHGSAPLR